MSSASRPESQSPKEEPFGRPQPRELQVLSRHGDGVPSNNSEPNASPELESREGNPLPQGREPILVGQDVPMNALAAEAEPVTEKPKRRAARRWADWTPPEGLKAFVRERQSGKTKGTKDTYYTLPGVSKNFRSIPEVQRHLQKKPVRTWKKKSGTQPSQPAASGSSSNLLDPQPAAEASQESPETRIKDEDRKERPKSRPKVCVQRNLFKPSRRQRQKNLLRQQQRDTIFASVLDPK